TNTGIASRNACQCNAKIEARSHNDDGGGARPATSGVGARSRKRHAAAACNGNCQRADHNDVAHSVCATRALSDDGAPTREVASRNARALRECLMKRIFFVFLFVSATLLMSSEIKAQSQQTGNAPSAATAK